MELNLYNSVKTASIKKNIPVETWFDLIKYGTFDKPEILKARESEKGSEFYTKIKQSLPCVTYNFLFNQRKSNKNIIGSTGLMYIDIDDKNFDILCLPKEYIFAYYKSFGGEGYSIVVKVENLTLDNFKQVYLEVCNFLKTTDYIDFGAVKATQYSVLSFDENLYCNLQSKNIPITYTNILLNNNINNNKDNNHITHVMGIKSQDNQKTIRYNNIDEFDFESISHIENWNGLPYISCFMPFMKKGLGRNNILLSYCNNLVYLNNHITKQRAIDVLSTINDVVFIAPVELSQIKRVVDSIFKYNSLGTLKPIYFNKKRKIIFNPTTRLSLKDKKEIIVQCINEKRKRDSIEKIKQCISGWDYSVAGKITIDKLSSVLKMNKKTVSKYYKLFKDEILIIKLRK